MHQAQSCRLVRVGILPCCGNDDTNMPIIYVRLLLFSVVLKHFSNTSVLLTTEQMHCQLLHLLALLSCPDNLFELRSLP